MRACVLFSMLASLSACASSVDPRHLDVQFSRSGAGYDVSGRYGPGWSEGDVRGEVERRCHAKSMALRRFAGLQYSESRGTGFSAYCGKAG
ncbi:hypothetical protein [Phaeobacter sp. B1627]|uniref:hypothetical protein n=1 Tax=Phaeobacter sp. B1627 TaxID=2583809 RepID=UPI001119A3B7|nr:hypothetical protein [Phaeobacter sp. B1627]TNJ39972.1 hypothetical protein FGE21_18350 [Phaeobacter sp. B1627]